jgi:ASC-1-like (ASCH) protein
VGPENVAQGYSQKPSDDSSEPLANSKNAHDLGVEILNIIRKQANAQQGISGTPGKDVNSESVSDEQESVDKNSVKPENNKQNYSQKPSSDSSEPVAEAKKAEVEELAAKVASYELGRQFCASLLKSAAEEEYAEIEKVAQDELEFVKEAGRRDFDTMISEAADNLYSHMNEEAQIKQAQLEGAAAFDQMYKQASMELLAEENATLQQKVAAYENLFKQATEEHEMEELQKAAEINQAVLAENVASTVLDKLKTEVAS